MRMHAGLDCCCCQHFYAVASIFCCFQVFYQTPTCQSGLSDRIILHLSNQMNEDSFVVWTRRTIGEYDTIFPPFLILHQTGCSTQKRMVTFLGLGALPTLYITVHIQTIKAMFKNSLTEWILDSHSGFEDVHICIWPWWPPMSPMSYTTSRLSNFSLLMATIPHRTDNHSKI